MKKDKLKIIVQAGGRGSRLRHHTWNKPKCLVSINGKPIIYHLFDLFTESDFIIVGDYLFNKLEDFLKINIPKVNFSTHQTSHKGTLAGIKNISSGLGYNNPIVITWSDIVVHKKINFTKLKKPTIFITNQFTCRWSINLNNKLEEVPSSTRGVFGLFFFPNKSFLESIDEEGEFVNWLSKNLNDFDTVLIESVEELGDLENIEFSNEKQGFSRFFNKVSISKDLVTKQVIDKNFKEIHLNEIKWYEVAKKLGFRRIPKIFKTNPLKMEKIIGNHAYEMTDLNLREKNAILADHLDTLISLHDLKSIPGNANSMKEVYFNKTIQRVKSVSSLIPNFSQDIITINGLKCRNPFVKKYDYILNDALNNLGVRNFTPIHGDPTFSNSIVDSKLRSWLIDPRGYFSSAGIFGDPLYDFAKVYYSAVGGYDYFNRRKFKLYVDTNTIEIIMEKSPFEDISQNIFTDYFKDDFNKIKIIHGLIWLSLSGYAKDDIDSIIGSFGYGIYWLEKSHNAA